MAWRLCILLLVVTALPARADQPASGGHELEIGLFGGYLDFDDEIRFENDTFLGLQASMGVTRWLHLGFDLTQATVRDSRRSVWVSTITASVRARMEPLPSHRVSPGLLVGVSFFAFEDKDNADALSEGLDLGPSVRWALTPRWFLRGDVVVRLQTLRLTKIDADGEPIGDAEETGYLWSSLYRVGLSHVF